MSEKEYYRQKAKRNLQAVIEQEINMRFLDLIKTTLFLNWNNFEDTINNGDFDYIVMKYSITNHLDECGYHRMMLLMEMAVKNNKTLAYQKDKYLRYDYRIFKGERTHHFLVKEIAKDRSRLTRKNVYVFHYEEDKTSVQVFSHELLLYTINFINGKFDYKNSWLIEELPSA
ncbi:MAG: hypothetical protein ABIF40_05400 [archaeon]